MPKTPRPEAGLGPAGARCGPRGRPERLPDAASTARSRRDPAHAVASYPFPWPPGTGLSALTAAQEEHRHAIARAIRGNDAENLNAAVAAAYGWPADLEDAELLKRLGELNRARAG